MSQFYKAKSDFKHAENSGLYSSDYLTNKKNKLAACGLKKSIYCKKKMTQSDYLALNRVLLSKTNVVGGTNNLLQNTFYTKELDNIPVVSEIGKQSGVGVNTISYTSPTAIVSSDTPFYSYYRIDTENVLLGKTCDVITAYQ
jgi:hypothetical protein